MSSSDKIEEILDRIDSVIGPPESETPEEHAKRVESIQRGIERRRAQRSARQGGV